MIRISLPYIFQLAQQLEPLSSLQEDNDVQVKDVWFPLLVAEQSIVSLHSSSVFGSNLRSSYELGSDLLKQIRSVTELKFDSEEVVQKFHIYQIKRLYEQYKVALLAELGILPSYFVMQKGGYDTNALLERGWCVFPNSVREKVPEAIFDLNEAAKALAFDMPTSCGYHVFRAVESVLRRYYSAVTGGKSQPKVRNISVYINAMRQVKAGDEKILSALEQLSKLHRNPLIHPDVVLNLDESISILGMAQSVITVMLVILPVLPSTTTGAPEPISA